MYLCTYSYWPLLGKCEIVPVLCRTSKTKRKLLYIQSIIFSPDWNLIMDLSIKINIVKLHPAFAIQNIACSKQIVIIVQFIAFNIDNFNIYWLVKNIWHAWNICNVIFYLHAHQAKEKNGQHLTKIHHINLISGKKNPKVAKHIIYNTK